MISCLFESFPFIVFILILSFSYSAVFSHTGIGGPRREGASPSSAALAVSEDMDQSALVAAPTAVPKIVPEEQEDAEGIDALAPGVDELHEDATVARARYTEETLHTGLLKQRLLLKQPKRWPELLKSGLRLLTLSSHQNGREYLGWTWRARLVPSGPSPRLAQLHRRGN